MHLKDKLIHRHTFVLIKKEIIVIILLDYLSKISRSKLVEKLLLELMGMLIIGQSKWIPQLEIIM